MTVRVPSALRDPDPRSTARAAGLVYYTDERDGLSRRRCGRGFTFLDTTGIHVVPPERDRLVALAVPPAWERVWLSPLADGHLQACGWDGAERKQYRYHDAFRAACDDLKFRRLRYFGRALRLLREWTDDELAGTHGTRDHAIATVLRLLDVGLLRVGNEESARAGAHGATTLMADHLDPDPEPTTEAGVLLEFAGKGGKARQVTVVDEVLTEALCRYAADDEPRLIHYRDPVQGDTRRVDAGEVNAAIAAIAGPAFSAKDFRTWGGSRAALEARIDGAGEVEAVDAAAAALGNTRAVARASYVHPAVLDRPVDDLLAAWRRSRRSPLASRGDSALAKLLA